MLLRRCTRLSSRAGAVASLRLLPHVRHHRAIAFDDNDKRSLYWEDRKPGGQGSQYCFGCGSQFHGELTRESRLVKFRYPGKPAGRLCPRCASLQQGEILAASDGVREADPQEFENVVGPLFKLRPALVLMVLDATDVDGTLIADAL